MCTYALCMCPKSIHVKMGYIFVQVMVGLSVDLTLETGLSTWNLLTETRRQHGRDLHLRSLWPWNFAALRSCTKLHTLQSRQGLRGQELMLCGFGTLIRDVQDQVAGIILTSNTITAIAHLPYAGWSQADIRMNFAAQSASVAPSAPIRTVPTFLGAIRLKQLTLNDNTPQSDRISCPC